MEEDIFNTELGRKILALTKASFKVSDLISDLVLREKIKLQILNVCKIFFEKKYPELLKELDILDSFFFLAGHLNLAREEHVKTLRNGLLVFKSQIVLTNYDAPKYSAFAKASADKPEGKEKPTGPNSEKLSDRQEKIMKQFQNDQKLQLSDLTRHFPGLSERTIRNDLSYLINIGHVIRHGKGSGSRYSAETL